MYVSEHNTIALTHERINDLHRDAAKIRLEREARGDHETTTGHTFNFFGILRRFVPVQAQTTTEPAVRTKTLRHA